MNTYRVVLSYGNQDFYLIANSAGEAFDLACDLGFTAEQIDAVLGMGTAGQNFALAMREV